MSSKTKDEPFDPETGEVLPDDDGEQEFDLPKAEASDDIALETLSGDLRDAMLTRFRQAQKPWAQMTEAEQQDYANGLGLTARDLVRKAVQLLNDHEWPHTVVELGEVKIGGTKGIEAKITCGNIEHNRTVLGEHVGQHIMVLMVDSDTFMGERAAVKVDPDQPELGIEPGDDKPVMDGSAIAAEAA